MATKTRAGVVPLEQSRALSVRLSPELLGQLRRGLPEVAAAVVAAITSEVPSYADPFSSGMGETIERAVQVALDGFLALAMRGSEERESEPAPQRAVRDAAHALGRGEARAGRSLEALTAAYGVGTRVAWRAIGAQVIAAGLPAVAVARFAELLFAYLNEISVQSINGHTEELASAGRVRERRLERLAEKLLAGEPDEDLYAAARLAEWEPSRYLIAVLVASDASEAAALRLDPRVLHPSEDVADADGASFESRRTVLLVPAGDARDRIDLLGLLRHTRAIVGPLRAWTGVRESYLRAQRGLLIAAGAGAGPIDTDAQLLELVLGSDPVALAELRDRVLAPLVDLNENAREKLTATLRAWLLHHGRREAIAAELVVHPQTVRYRLGQLRGLYGERLTEPRFVAEATAALGGG